MVAVREKGAGDGKDESEAHLGLTTLATAPLLFFVGVLIASGNPTYGIVLCILVAAVTADALQMGATGVLLAMLANTLTKAGIATALGNAIVRKWVAIGSLVTLASIAAGWGLLRVV